MADFNPKDCPLGIELATRLASSERNIERGLTDIRSDLQGLSRKVDKLADAIFGNGGPGLRGEVQDVKGRITRLESETEGARAWGRQVSLARWGWAVAIGIAFFGFIVQLVWRYGAP